MRPVTNASAEIVFLSFRQHHADNDLRGSELVDPPARPNAVSKAIGSEIDFIVALRNLWNVGACKWTLGLFRPGAAFDPRREHALLNKINVSFRF